MKSNMPADSDRTFHAKVCKLHWRIASNVSGVIDIMIPHSINVYCLILPVWYRGHTLQLWTRWNSISVPQVPFSSSGGLTLFPHARPVISSTNAVTRLPTLKRNRNITFQVCWHLTWSKLLFQVYVNARPTRAAQNLLHFRAEGSTPGNGNRIPAVFFKVLENTFSITLVKLS